MATLLGLPLLLIFAAFAVAMFLERISALLALPLMAVAFLLYAVAVDLGQPNEVTEIVVQHSTDSFGRRTTSMSEAPVASRFSIWRSTLQTQRELLHQNANTADRLLQTIEQAPVEKRLPQLREALRVARATDADAQQTINDLPHPFQRPPHYGGQVARFQQVLAGESAITILTPLIKPLETNAAEPGLIAARQRVDRLLAQRPAPTQVKPWRSGLQYLGEYMIFLLRAGSLHLYATILATVFGGMFAMYVRNLKVAERFVYWTAEYAGETPLIVTGLVFLATALIFSSIGGLGTVIMLGTIILPVLRSVGLSPVVAAGTFLIAIAMGGTLHPVSRRLWLDFYGLSPDELDSILWTMVLLYLLCGLAWIVWGTRRKLLSSFHSEPAATPVVDDVPAVLMLAPLLPVALVYFFRIEEITTFVISIVYMYLCVCRRRGAVRILSRSLIEGAQAVVPPCLLMIGIGLLVVSLSTEPVQAYLRPLLRSVVPTTQLGYIVLFSLAAPLALYRGPLNVWGMGLAVSATLLAVSPIPAAAVLGVILAAGMLQGVCDPTNTQNVWIAGYQGIGVNQILRYTILPVWVAAILAVIIFGLRFVGG